MEKRKSAFEEVDEELGESEVGYSERQRYRPLTKNNIYEWRKESRRGLSLEDN